MEPVYLKAPVRAIIYHNDTLIWGEGDLLHAGDEVIRIPGSERIIGIDSGSNDSIFIRTEFNLYNYHMDTLLNRIPLITRDRILAVLEEQDKIWVVQARGTVQLFTVSSNHQFTYSKSYSLSEFNAVFYSASIIRKFDKIEIAYGTIFSGILLAEIDERSESKIYSIGNISGHRGTIFDIKHHPKDQNIIVSCSDDRSICIWKRNIENGGIFESLAICNGHEARVWAIYVRDDVIASVSEDNTCRIWDLSGNCIKTIEGDSYSKSIWSVALNNNADKVTIGSNDGSVISYSFRDLSKSSDIIDYILPGSFGSIKNIIISNEGICYAATDQDKLVEIPNNRSVCIKGISKFPAMAVNSKTFFIADDEGNVFSHEFKCEDFTVQNLLSLEGKISKIYAQDEVLFLEAVNCEYYLYCLVKKEIKRIEIDKKHKITSFYHFKDQIFIGTRQGTLLIFQLDPLVPITIQLTQQESLKSIKVTNDNEISVLDRSGYEIILDLNNFNILHCNKIGKGILEGHLGTNFISSFYQQYFNVNSPGIGLVERILCGGGHRLWSVASTTGNSIYFAFMSNGKLTIIHRSLEKVKMISSKCHGKEIRCSLNLKEDLIVSGSEDGLLILYEGLNFKNELRLSNISIKCIASIEDLIFVGGSNETIEAFKLNNNNNNNFFFNHLSTCPKQIKSLETRVLCLDVNRFNDNIIILAGYSDASIRLFEYQKDSFILTAKVLKVHQQRCVQQIRFLPSGDSLKFISAGADGIIQAWTLNPEGILEMTWNSCVHQSGINSIDIDIKSIDDTVSILTGGDDGSISLLKVKNDKIEKITTKNVHNSTVTGVKFFKGDTFISASIDRYIYIQDTNNFEISKGFRTVISDISTVAMTGSKSNLFVYGAGIEAFKI